MKALKEGKKRDWVPEINPDHPLFCSPGMPEMLSPGAALIGAGLGKTVALVTDGRFSGASHGQFGLPVADLTLLLAM